MASKFFGDHRKVDRTFKARQQAKADKKAELVWQTLERTYPEEIKEIHALQAQDMTIYGKIQPATDEKMNQFLNKVVEDNKKYGRT